MKRYKPVESKRNWKVEEFKLGTIKKKFLKHFKRFSININ